MTYKAQRDTIKTVKESAYQEVEVDENGGEEWGDIWDFSEFRITVENEHYDAVATFNNFHDAEKFVNESDEELKIV